MDSLYTSVKHFIFPVSFIQESYKGAQEALEKCKSSCHVVYKKNDENIVNREEN